MTERIAATRDGQALSAHEIDGLIQEYTRGELPDYQAAAWLMAVYLRGLSPDETAALTAAMARSGRQLDLTDLPHALDKHSTGGVGDKTSLIVVPMLAAAGVPVCKMSGRGLGHTGGTLDKLEAIPGFRIALTPEEMKTQAQTIGACLAGQTDDLAPADKKLYALRDVTATVASLPLIVASILSKKLAGGAPSFLFDVKVGSGALMKSLDDATALAEALVAGSVASGRRAVAVLSDMSQPLGRTIGNALEVAEAIRVLDPKTTDSTDARLRELCLTLATEGIALALGLTHTLARARAEEVLLSGTALRSFGQIIAAQDGDPSVVDHPERLPTAPVVRPIFSAPTQTGWIAAIDAEALGTLVVALGGGRAKKDDTIDPAVGLEIVVQTGDRLSEQHPLATVHARSEAEADHATEAVRAALTLSPTPSTGPALIHRTIGSNSARNPL